MKHRVNLLIAFLALAAVSLTACQTARGDRAALEQGAWVLESYGEASSPKAILEGSEITAAYDGSRVTGSAGCNTYAGDYRVRGSKLTVGALEMTERACMSPEGVMEQEIEYARALGSAESYEIRDGQPHIACADDQTLVYRVKE
jgi:heat shock protein HslJ